jgi:hypothetical protein
VDQREEAAIKRAFTEDAIKRVLTEDYGLTVGDTGDLQLLVRTKMAGMNTLDRAAFTMRVGQFVGEAEAGGLPKRRYYLLSYAIFATIASFIWHPSAVIIALFACSNVRGFAVRHALFWTNHTAIAIGGFYGILLAVIVRFGTALTTHATAIAILLGAVGFLAAGYIGYGVTPHEYVRGHEDDMRLLAQISAPGCYLVAVTALLFWHFQV